MVFLAGVCANGTLDLPSSVTNAIQVCDGFVNSRLRQVVLHPLPTCRLPRLLPPAPDLENRRLPYQLV